MKVISSEELKDYRIVIEDRYYRMYYGDYKEKNYVIGSLEIEIGKFADTYVTYVTVEEIIKDEAGNITGVKIDFANDDYENDKIVLDFDSTKVEAVSTEGEGDVYRRSNLTMYIAHVDNLQKIKEEFMKKGEEDKKKFLDLMKKSKRKK